VDNASGMGGTDFTLALTLAAGMLAAWIDVRLGEARPAEPMQRVVHVGLSIFGLFAATGLLYLVHGVPQGLFMVVVLTVFVPALVYALLAGIWMMRALADLTGLAGR
jgi:hypothetical protein